ncbi:hypothetical protein GYMLUDRAFT_705162 [Collybiopsis luxurians FD-317 M1]|uniref:Uncharacterized protein n=1 Tax=Collybiopsis luxurians FD-317 M1 TaxID=944289 RepID=A0A0D0CR90_9AGAR|nr:hypothetical protein GYMLUDRAFT_705162 [Collybiopsis luxurians FD-317 M1]
MSTDLLPDSNLHVILSTITLYELLRSQTLTDLVSGIISFTEPDAHYFAFAYFNLAAATVFIVARCSYTHSIKGWLI